MRRLPLSVFLFFVALLSACSLSQPAPTPPSPPPDYSTLNATAVQQEDGLTVSVVGAVNKPGNYRLKPGATVAEALTAAGGLTDIAHAAVTTINRKFQSGTRRLVIDCRPRDDAAALPMVSDGDSIFVPQRIP